MREFSLREKGNFGFDKDSWEIDIFWGYLEEVRDRLQTGMNYWVDGSVCNRCDV